MSPFAGINRKQAAKNSIVFRTFPELVKRAAEAYGAMPAFSDRNGGHWRSISFSDCASISKSIAYQLAQRQRPLRCMIFSESRLEWPLAFLGIMTAGSVAVPVDAKSTPQELATFLQHTEPGVLMISPKLETVAEQAISLASWQGDLIFLDMNNRDDTRALGAFEPAAADFAGYARGEDDTAVIAFTSATSGQPKGVETSVHNLLHQIESLCGLFDVKTGDRFLSILPLSHLLELSCGFLAAYAIGCHISYLNSILPLEIKDALKQRQISHMIVVPLLMEMIRKGIERNFAIRFGVRGPAILNVLQQLSSKAPSPTLKRLLNRIILKELGPDLQTLIVGGATLDASTLKFFSNLGIDAWQGYGLTETSPVAAVNSPRHYKPGSVGRPMPFCDIRIESVPGEDIGEILVKGPCVMNGYFNDSQQTQEAIDVEGWFRTGDLGYLSEDRYLFITGRKKNLIVLDGGKKVYPEEVEKVLSPSPIFQELCVTGLLVPHPSLPGKLTEQVAAVIVPQLHLRESMEAGELQRLCEQEVRRLGDVLSAHKRPVRVVVQQHELPKTRTGKIKAPAVKDLLTVKQLAARKQRALEFS